MQIDHLQLAKLITELFAVLPDVAAVALGGTRGSGAALADSASDIDLYIYTHAGIPLATRAAIVERAGGATVANLGLDYWGPGDEWFHAPTGVEIDCVYFDAAWMAGQIERVIDRHQASQGYSTCFCSTVRNSTVLYDPWGWFADLQQQCRREYPEALRQNIIILNHPLFRGIIPAYAHQVEKAVKRNDLVSINHRLAALFASYFDIIFAANRQWHPGEKRLVQHALRNCSRLPVAMEQEITAVFQAAAGDVAVLPARLEQLLDHLDELLHREGFAI